MCGVVRRADARVPCALGTRGLLCCWIGGCAFLESAWLADEHLCTCRSCRSFRFTTLRYRETTHWEAERAVAARGSGGAAARAERLEKRRRG
jgi:hypothetical protein